MKKILTIVAVVMGLVVATDSAKAQGGTKIGFISLQELIPTMPEYKKADTALNDYQTALRQNFDDMQREYYEKDSVVTSRDTLKLTKAQLEIKRKEVSELLVKLQSWQQQAQQMMQQKQQDLIAPIQKKAVDAVNAVAKENGFTYVFSKEVLLVSPPAEDLLPLVKKKLGLK